MTTKNKVFIATSIDGFITDRDGKIDWLHSISNPDDDDFGYKQFISDIEAVVMGRNTFETLLNFNIEWPFQIPVFVLSSSLTELPKELSEKVQLLKGDLKVILEHIHKKGYGKIYVDGGKTIQGFLKDDLIDEMTITIIPILLGTGRPLFSDDIQRLDFECVKTELFLNRIVQNKFIRKRK